MTPFWKPKEAQDEWLAQALSHTQAAHPSLEAKNIKMTIIITIIMTIIMTIITTIHPDLTQKTPFWKPKGAQDEKLAQALRHTQAAHPKKLVK